MEKLPEPEPEFELFERRLISWRRAGYQTLISLYRHLEDDSMHVLIQEYGPDGESYRVVPCAGHSVYGVFNDALEF